MHGEEYDEATSIESFNAFDAGGDGSVSWPEFRYISHLHANTVASSLASLNPKP